MKIINTASAVRVTFTPTEIADLQFVIEAGRARGPLHARARPDHHCRAGEQRR